MKVDVGQKAPDFSLYDSDRQRMTLIDYRGKNIVLLFFPFAFFRVCTTELCQVRDSIGNYERLSAQVFGISVDSHYTLATYKQEQNLNFPLLSDFNKEVSGAYGVLYEKFGLDMKGVAKRSAFVIDRHGIVQYAEVLENSGETPNFNRIQEVLSTLS